MHRWKVRNNIQVKVILLNCHDRHRRRVELYFYARLTSALDGVGWPAPRSGRFSSWEEPQVRISQEAGWVLGPVRTWRTENLLYPSPTGVRIPGVKPVVRCVNERDAPTPSE